MLVILRKKRNTLYFNGHLRSFWHPPVLIQVFITYLSSNCCWSLATPLQHITFTLNTVKNNILSLYLFATLELLADMRSGSASVLLIQHSVQDVKKKKSPVLFLLLLGVWGGSAPAVMLPGATVKGRGPKTTVQLSEAVVGGRVPWWLAQQTVCGVL